MQPPRRYKRTASAQVFSKPRMPRETALSPAASHAAWWILEEEGSVNFEAKAGSI